MKINPSKDVLIVDDDDSLRHIMKTALTRAGLTCDTAADGIYALEQLRSTPYTFVLLDVVMPRLDGPGVLRELRSLPLPGTDRPFVVMVTGSPDREALLPLGDLVQVIIRKPVHLEQLTDLVRDCVTARGQRARGHQTTQVT
jgi:two-component system chemotaxis response regulator CheY